ncbi:tubulin binding cofactor C-domain-containing protein [Schizophyllum commune]
MTDSAWIKDFGTTFQKDKDALQTRIEAAKASSPASPLTLQELTSEISKLMTTLADASGSLPSYDQRQYEIQVKTLEKSVEELRSTTVKPKFAFKRKAAASSQSPAPSAPSAPKPAGDTGASAAAGTGTSPAATSASVANTTAPSTNLLLSSHKSKYLTVTDLPAPFKQESDLALADLEGCVVDLLGRADLSGGAVDVDSPGRVGVDDPTLRDPSLLNISAVHIRNISDSLIVLPLISGSVMLHDITRSIVVVGCHQFRMHTSKAVDVYLSITSNPIIEHCSEIRFSPYPSALAPDAPSNGLQSIQDFSHIRATPSPNWTRLDNEQQADIPGLLQLAKENASDLSGVLAKVLPGRGGEA